MEFESQSDARLLPVILEFAHSHSPVSREEEVFPDLFSTSDSPKCGPFSYTHCTDKLYSKEKVSRTLLHLHTGISSSHYQIEREACARLTINAVILQSQINTMHSQKNKKKEGEAKICPF